MKLYTLKVTVNKEIVEHANLSWIELSDLLVQARATVFDSEPVKVLDILSEDEGAK